MDITGSKVENRGMRRQPQKRKPKPFVRSYVGEWLAYLGIAPVELVKADVISEGYLSLIRSGARQNVSPGMLVAIGNYLGIEWSDLYKEPPGGESSGLHVYHPRTMLRLTQGLSR